MYFIIWLQINDLACKKWNGFGNSVGVADNMVAEIVLQLSNGKNIQEAFLYGVASGRAATMNAGMKLCHKKMQMSFTFN